MRKIPTFQEASRPGVGICPPFVRDQQGAQVSICGRPTSVRVIVAVLVAAVVPIVSPAGKAWAAAGDITTIAGGYGWGPASNVGQDVRAVAAAGSHLWVLSQSVDFIHYDLRVIDTTTGEESVPVTSIYPVTSDWFTCPMPLGPWVAGDPSGNAYIAFEDPKLGGVVERVTPAGQATIVAGGGSDVLADRNGLPATSEALGSLGGIALDGAGDIFVSEDGWSVDDHCKVSATASRVRKVSPNGTIKTVAGVGAVGLSGDGGNGASAKLNGALGLAAAPSTGALFIADTGNHRVRRLAPNGTITTYAGGGSSTADGARAVQSAVSASYLAFDRYLLLEDDATCRVRRVVDGLLTTIAGNGTCGSTGDGGAATGAQLKPQGIAAAGSNTFVVQNVDTNPGEINGLRRVDAAGTIDWYAGTLSVTYGGDGGPARQAQFASHPLVAIDGAGNVYVTDDHDTTDLRLRRIDPAGTMTTFAGNGTLPRTGTDTGDGGPATDATFKGITDVGVAPDGSVYIADAWDQRIRRVDASGIITTVAGVGSNGTGADADGIPATQAVRTRPSGLAFDSAGDLVFGDRCRLRRVDAQGIITTIAGSTTCGDAGDGGPATAASLQQIVDVTTDAAGNIYVAAAGSSNGDSVRRIDPSGTITTVAGGGSFTTDGLAATQQDITVQSIAVDAQNRLLIVDSTGVNGTTGRVRRVDTDGTITTVAGGGTGGDGGPATAAELSTPVGLAVDAAGNMFIGCSAPGAPAEAGAVREVTAS
jgi:hypothetical protein